MASLAAGSRPADLQPLDLEVTKEDEAQVVLSAFPRWTTR